MRKNKKNYRDVLSESDCELHERVLRSYEIRRVECMRYSSKHVRQVISIVNSLVVHSELPPWRWSVDNFDSWFFEQAYQKNLKEATQRSYAHAIKVFLDYLVTNCRFRIEAMTRTGYYPRQIVTLDDVCPYVFMRGFHEEK